MNIYSWPMRFILAIIIPAFMSMTTPKAETDELHWMKDATLKLEQEFAAKYDAAQRLRLQRGLSQIAKFWTQDDGDTAVFEEFARKNFPGDQATLDLMFSRVEHLFEQLNGHMNKISLEFRAQTDLDRGPILPFDELFAGYDPGAHLTDDFFKNKLAFVVLLNFPLTTLEQRLSEGQEWRRRQWAEARLAQRFAKRIPAEVKLAIAQAGADADQYIAEYNIWMHHLIGQDGKRLFPRGLRLLSHWDLRDEIKASYRDKTSGLPKQRIIQKVMERIITQTIPQAAINNPQVDWNPYANEVKPTSSRDDDSQAAPDTSYTNSPEPDTRYEKLLNCFLAAKKADPYSPTAPTLIARRFDEDREIPEKRVRSMFEQVLTSPLMGQVARRIESRLGRTLEPFDIWYDGFRQRGKLAEPELDKIAVSKYPDAESFRRDLPRLLEQLGFAQDRAALLADNILVDPARGSGHAWGAAMRSEKAHLRTRIEKGGMNFKGFNVAMHELGHNVEQTFSLNCIDHVLLEGVPNTAFTEAMAFVFQAHDLELLGVGKPESDDAALKALNDFWATCEIAGVALVDMAVWHWMYEHPEATPADLKAAVIQISKNVWNKFFAPVFNQKDVILLGVYSHMIHSFLYLPDYPIGHLIACQIEQQIKKTGNLATEIERMATIGRIAPDIWMRQATGAPVGPEALLAAAQLALHQMPTELPPND